MDLPTLFAEWTSDDVLFPTLQIFLALFILFAVFQSWLKASKTETDSVERTIPPDEASVSGFYVSYVVLIGLFIAICLSVDIAQRYRIFWVIIDTILVTYLCLSNVWFRNLLMDWTNQFMKMGQR